MKSKGPLPCSHEPATMPSLETYETSQNSVIWKPRQNHTNSDVKNHF
jgi:hypothetical protein